MNCTLHKLVADVCLISDDQVLLVKYLDVSRYDGQVGWFLPDDFLLIGEHPNDAAKRIVREQLGLDLADVRLNHIESFGGDEDAWHLIFHYYAEFPTMPRTSPGVNVKEARWFPVRELPSNREIAHGGWAKDVLAEILSGI
jgi:ADP-ribose pyrophosphatase YjhB (NUDIX family)